MPSRRCPRLPSQLGWISAESALVCGTPCVSPRGTRREADPWIRNRHPWIWLFPLYVVDRSKPQCARNRNQPRQCGWSCRTEWVYLRCHRHRSLHPRRHHDGGASSRRASCRRRSCRRFFCPPSHHPWERHVAGGASSRHRRAFSARLPRRCRLPVWSSSPDVRPRGHSERQCRSRASISRKNAGEIEILIGSPL